jgi:uncharacterized damage-inducible protein DinB
MPTLVSLFEYKAWANRELFAEVDKLEGELRHTATRILNHIYVVDRIFASHLQGIAHGYAATNTPDTPELDELRFAVAESDAWYTNYAKQLSDSNSNERVNFTFTDGDKGSMMRDEILLHVTAHGAYHRGAVGRILSQAGLTPPRDLFTKFLHVSEPARRSA